MNNAYQEILEQYETFSALQKKAADYIINNIENAIYFSVSKFADTIDVSHATIVRFAQNLGYPGFNEFRDSLFEYYRDRLSPDIRMKHSIEALEDGSSTYKQITKREMLYMEKSISTLDETELCGAVETIRKCRTLYIFAVGSNEHLGCYLRFKLRRLKIHCHLVTDSGMMLLEHLLSIGPEDSAIIYSFARHSKDFNRTIKLLSDKDVPIILISDIKSPPVIRLASFVLYSERGPQGTFQSPVVPMTITNTLFLKIAEGMEENAVTALGELGQMRDKYYYKGIPNNRENKTSL